MGSNVNRRGRAHHTVRVRFASRAHLLDLLAARDQELASLATERADLRERLDDVGVLLRDVADEPGVPPQVRELCAYAAAQLED